MRRRGEWTVCAVLAAGLALAGCQTPGQVSGKPSPAMAGGASLDLPTAVAELRRLPQTRDAILGAAAGVLTAEPGACAGGSAMLDRHMPLDARRAGDSVAVRWVETVAVRGCPSQTYVRVMVDVTSGAPEGARLSGRTMDRGNGLTDPLQYAQASRNARPVVEAALGCTGRDMFYPLTRFEGFSGPAAANVAGREARPWRETWLWPGCGKIGEVSVQFTPDRTGVAANADPRVRVRPQTSGERASVERAVAARTNAERAGSQPPASSPQPSSPQPGAPPRGGAPGTLQM